MPSASTLLTNIAHFFQKKNPQHFNLQVYTIGGLAVENLALGK